MKRLTLLSSILVVLSIAFYVYASPQSTSLCGKDKDGLGNACPFINTSAVQSEELGAKCDKAKGECDKKAKKGDCPAKKGCDKKGTCPVKDKGEKKPPATT